MSLSIDVGQFLNRIWDAASFYLARPRSGVQRLRGDAELLRAKLEDVKQTIDEQITTAEVQQWKTQAEESVSEFDAIERDYGAMRCLGDWSWNCICINRRVTRNQEAAKALIDRRDAFRVDAPPPPAAARVRLLVELPISNDVVGMQSDLNQMVSSISDGSARVIGIYGLGGIGKTTLLTLIHNHEEISKLQFEHVVWIVASKECKLRKLQMGLAEQVGLNPLICPTPLEQECFSTVPVPISQDQEKEEVCLGNLRRFHFRELQVATNNFSSKNLLGKGGFGNVYKGQLQDGTLVAVKRLNDGNALGGEIQFRTEVKMINLAVHRHLLRLYGICMTATERLLVYPYMLNGSVASRLKAKPALDWSTRKRIALGSGRGLLYLHEQCDPKIIHRDVKAVNILLDDYCEAVVGDFGLAKLLDHKDTHITTALRGTVGHIAPEYLSTGQSSEKTDVLGFGILLLELITGLRALEFGKAAKPRGAMLDWVKKMHEEKRLDALADEDLRNYDMIELEEMVQVALLCTQYLPGHRPKMSEVVLMMEGDGLAERWEASQRAEVHKLKASECSSECFSDLTDDLLVEAMELSRPR